MLEAGDMMPRVALVDAQGAPVDLFAGDARYLVVYFYPKADTPGCTNEAKDFTALSSDFTAAGAQVIGVSKDKPAKLGKFAAKYDLAVRLVADESAEGEGGACEAFGTWVEKSLYGRKYMGIARATFLIDGQDGKILRVWPAVKVKGHAQEVLDALRSL